MIAPSYVQAPGASPATTPILADRPPPRGAPYELEPGYCPHAQVWLYGNVRLLTADLAAIPAAAGPPIQLPFELAGIEREAERQVLEGKVLVCGIHSPAHQRAAIVPLRWGAPRIVVFSGGFYAHLGEKLDQEAFRAARLWRYAWDPRTDLAVSRRAPSKLQTYARHNPTVDRLIQLIASRQMDGMRGPTDIWGRTKS